MSSSNNILKHELWKSINMEKLPEFKVIETKINHINLLSKKNNINILEKLCSKDSSEFITQLDELITSDKSNAKPINYDDYKKNLFINNIKQLSLNNNSFPASVINHKLDLKELNNNVNNPTNYQSVLNRNVNSNQFLFEDSEIIEEKVEKKKDYAFLNNHDLLSPLKGNFSLSLKYYNNQEFLTFLNRKFNKDINKINSVLNDSKKLSLVKQEFTVNCENRENKNLDNYKFDGNNENKNIQNIEKKKLLSSKNAKRKDVNSKFLSINF